MEIPINDQIAAVKRHLIHMENTYPRLVRQGVISQDRAGREIASFTAALDTLMRARGREESYLRTYSSPSYDPYLLVDTLKTLKDSDVALTPPDRGQVARTSAEKDRLVQEANVNLNQFAETHYE
jgi:hypothetical protein